MTSAQYREQRLEDHIVRALMDFDDISYDDHADLLYELAGQVVAHLRGYLAKEDIRNVLQYYERQMAEFVHAQMQPHYWENVSGYDVVVTKGFSTLKPSAFTASATDKVRDFRQAVEDKSRSAAVGLWRLQTISAELRLLSEEVGFKDLGLLIVDEEHRFGVGQKRADEGDEGTWTCSRCRRRRSPGRSI